MVAKKNESEELELDQDVMENEETDEEELEESEEEQVADENAITVHYRERSITRRFGPGQVLKSGGDLKRVFSESEHGKKYRVNAMDFIRTMMLKDEDYHQRPRLLKVEGLNETEMETLPKPEKPAVRKPAEVSAGKTIEE